jgi:hypothetical protein
MLQKVLFAGINRKLSPWDFVPIVGSVKQVVNGVQDIYQGERIFGIVSIVAGLGCLALDGATIFSLATGLAPAAVATQAAAKTVGKTSLTKVVWEVAKIAGSLSKHLAPSVICQQARIFTRFKFFHRAEEVMQGSG